MGFNYNIDQLDRSLNKNIVNQGTQATTKQPCTDEMSLNDKVDYLIGLCEDNENRINDLLQLIKELDNKI